MKKRIGAVTALVLLFVMMATSFSFAGTLELKDSYPRDGGKGMQVENSGVKLYFNQKMINKKNEDANLACFKLTDEKGKAKPIRVLYSPKEEGLVLVLVDKETLESDSSYKLSISGDVMSASGHTLGENVQISFDTVDTGAAMRVNMIMMAVMMVGVIWFSTKSMKKQEEKSKAAAGAEDKVNPYKIAKETGKPVEEIVAKDQKEKEKQRKKLERKMSKESNGEEEEEVIRDGKMHVKAPRTVASGGSTYITGRKAAAEAAARAKAAAGTTRPKNKKKK